MKENNKKELQKSEVGKPSLVSILSGKVGVNDFEKLLRNRKIKKFYILRQKKSSTKGIVRACGWLSGCCM